MNTNQEIIQVVQADESGRKVRRRRFFPNDSWRGSWYDKDTNGWDFQNFEYEVAPIPVPPGDLTWEEAEALRKEGVPIQYFSLTGAGREAQAEWKDRVGTCVSWRAYRRTPPSPAPRMVPTVLVGCVTWPLGEVFPKRNDRVESRDGGLTWARAEKGAK